MSDLKGPELEQAIIAFIERNVDAPPDGAYLSDLADGLAEWGNATFNERRRVEQAIARLVKRGELVEQRDFNDLPIYNVKP